MKIWAHRGCSLRHPENTLTAFKKAAGLFEKGLEGIELDVQLSGDGEIVVIHDERVDRTTDGFGFVRDLTFKELKTMHIHTGEKEPEYIPSLDEVLDILENELKLGLKLNIELKNNVYIYEGLEKKLTDLITKRDLEKNIVFSSFNARSLSMIRDILPDADTGILDTRVSDCLYKLRGGCGADALHPYWQGMDFSAEELKDYTVRAWFTGHLYPERPTGGRLDVAKLQEKGITDIFINEPEVYL